MGGYCATWLFFTDDHASYNWPENTIVHYCTFEEMKNYIQNKFDFNISLDKPYKLCDFKPAYGYIFQDYIKEYDFWGHCDVDMIWGDMRKFITDDLLEKYEFLYREGAFRLYKNTQKINNLYQCSGSIFGYREVFSTPVGFGFDEALSIQRIAERNDIRIYQNDNVIADIDAFNKPLYIRRVTKKRWKDEAGIFRSIENYKYQIFEYNHGRIVRHYLHGNEIKTDEFMYIHLLKRHMNMECVSPDNDAYLIVPNAFIGMQTGKELSENEVVSLSCADHVRVINKKIGESVYRRVARKCKRLINMKPMERKVILKKRLYFLYEIFVCNRKH